MTGNRYQISVMLTNDCNFRCSYCPALKRSDYIGSEQVDKLVCLIKRAAPSRIDLNIHGGEPLLAWERLVELTEKTVLASAGRNSSLNVCTNGTELTESKSEYLLKNRFNVRVSVDGDKETHIQNRFPRAAEDSALAGEHFDRTIRGLNMLVSSGVKTAVNMVVTPATVNSLLRNVGFLLKQGICSLSISPVIGKFWSGEKLLILDNQLKNLGVLFQRWMERRPTPELEDLRRSILSDINRASYCLGEHVNLPDAQIVVIGTNGEIYGDEPEEKTRDYLRIGHLDGIESFDDLPVLEKTGFQLLYDHRMYPRDILLSIRRSHKIVFNRMTELANRLF